MIMVNPAGPSQPARWRRRDEDRFGAGRRPSGATFGDTLAALPVPGRTDGPQGERSLHTRPAAAFVAQLLAARLKLTQTPRRRRGDRAQVDASYHAADPASQPTSSGSLVRRDI